MFTEPSLALQMLNKEPRGILQIKLNKTGSPDFSDEGEIVPVTSWVLLVLPEHFLSAPDRTNIDRTFFKSQLPLMCSVSLSKSHDFSVLLFSSLQNEANSI